jgi:hypothetical protein
MIVTIETSDVRHVDPQDVYDALTAANYFVERVIVTDFPQDRVYINPELDEARA